MSAAALPKSELPSLAPNPEQERLSRAAALLRLRGREVREGGQADPAFLMEIMELRETLGEAHEILAYLLLVLVGLHAAAAVFHQAILRDGTLSRMLPFVRAGDA